MPAREAKEAADVTRRYESRELMLELGGLADARPMTCDTTVTSNTCKTMYKISVVVRGYEVLVAVYLRHLTGAVPTLRGS